MQRPRPSSASVKRDGRRAEVELASTASGGATASSRSNTLHLHVEILGRVLLDVGGFRERLLQRVGTPIMRASTVPGALAVEQIVRGQIVQHAGDVVDCLARGTVRLVPQPHLGTGAGEADRPGPADEAGADDRDTVMSALSQGFDIAIDSKRLARDVRRRIGDSRKATMPATS